MLKMIRRRYPWLSNPTSPLMAPPAAPLCPVAVHGWLVGKELCVKAFTDSSRDISHASVATALSLLSTLSLTFSNQNLVINAAAEMILPLLSYCTPPSMSPSFNFAPSVRLHLDLLFTSA